MKTPHVHCSFCGWPFGDPIEVAAGIAQEIPWPRACVACNEITYRNPLPVVVIVVPTIMGVLAVRRGIPPDKGELALVSGYIDDQEHWRDAAIRELEEETSITSFHRDELILMDVESSKNMKHILIICRTPPISRNDIPNIEPNEEVQELVEIDDPAKLIWETHQIMAKRVLV